MDQIINIIKKNSMQKEAAIREPLILGHKTYHDITEDVCRPIEDKAPKMWYILFGIALIIGLYGVGCILYLLGTGVGVWGLNRPSVGHGISQTSYGGLVSDMPEP